MLWTCCTQYVRKFQKLSSGHRTGKGQFSFQSQRGECQRMFKLLYNCALFARKVMLKILLARLQQNVNWELTDVQTGFRKGRGTRDQIASIHWIMEKAREFQTTSTSTSFTMLKPLTVWIKTNWKILKDTIVTPPYFSPDKRMQIKKQ